MKKKFFKFSNLLSEKLNRREKHAIVLLSLLGLGVLLWISSGLYSWITKTSAQVTPEILILQTVKAKEVPMANVIETVGSLSAFGEVMIKAPAVGKVQNFLVESGSWVKSGTQLINLIGAPEVRAPFDGYLGDWRVKVGEIVQANTELIELVNADQMVLTYKVPEQYASQLDNNQNVDISVKAFPEKIFKGTVNYVAPLVDKKTYTILIKAKVDNQEQDLWPGMSAHVKQYLSVDPKAVVIPESALMLTLEGYEVFTLVEGKIAKRKVTIGSKDKGRVQIKSGLTVGDAVVITRTDAMKEGKLGKAVDWVGEW